MITGNFRFFIKFTYILMWTCLIIIASHTAKAQSNLSLKSVKATVQGTSSLHDWESEITKIEYKGSVKTSGNKIKFIRDVEVKILVESIKSKEGKIMDHKTYDAFKSDKNPFIIYSFKTSEINIGTDNNITIDASGNLTMAGTTKPVSLSAKGKILANGDLQIFITKKLKMTEFNMVPPAAVLGTIHVGDEVTVNFDIVLTNTNNLK